MKTQTLWTRNNNRLPFYTFVLAFVTYFGFWAYINQRPEMLPDWAFWRGSLVVGSLFLIGVFFLARGNSFTINAILIAFVIPVAVMLIWLVGFAFIYWRLPQLGANDVDALFLMEGMIVICGAFVDAVMKFATALL